ncbi:MAG: hypothetical protein ACK56I_18170, partial [bacterium]
MLRVPLPACGPRATCARMRRRERRRVEDDRAGWRDARWAGAGGPEGRAAHDARDRAQSVLVAGVEGAGAGLLQALLPPARRRPPPRAEDRAAAAGLQPRQLRRPA